jgi:heterodisulfide reductase subunit A2
MKNNDLRTAEGRETCNKSIEQWTLEGMPQVIRTIESDTEAEVIVLACRWRYFAGKDLEGLKNLASEVDYRVVRTPCSGQVDADWIAAALDSGAEAVMVMGGHKDDCAFAREPEAAEECLKARVDRQGLDPERVVVDWSDESRPEGLQRSVDQLVDRVKKATPSRP